MAKQNKKETLPSDVIVVEVEELVAPEAAAGTEIILAETTVRQIARQLAASYAGFSIDNLTTAEAVEEAKRDHGQLVKFRNALDKRRLAVNRTTNEFAKEIQALFSPIETTIKTALDAYKKREDDRIAEEKRKLDELKKTREAALYALKAYWNGSQWQLGAVFASEADLVADEATWLPVLEKFDTERKRIDEEERAKEMRLLVSERKVVLMEMGAVGRFESSGNPCAADHVGAVYGMRLGDAWATKADMESHEARWNSIVLHAFKKERKRLDDETAAVAKAAEPVALEAPAVAPVQKSADDYLDGVDKEREKITPPKSQPAEVNVPPAQVVSHQPITEPVPHSAELPLYAEPIPSIMDMESNKWKMAGALALRKAAIVAIKTNFGIDATDVLDRLCELTAKKYGYRLK